MTDAIIVDTSELDQLAADLGEVSRNAGLFVRKAVEVTAFKVRDDWRNNLKGLPHLPALPYAITYDITVLYGFGSSVIKAEIGPDKERNQGALGNFTEFGSVNNPPRGDGHAALQRFEKDFEFGLSKALEDAERASGFGATVRSTIGGRR